MKITQKLKNAGLFLLDRAREPSTWAAVASAGALLHANPETVANVGNVAPLVAALLGVFLSENKTDAAQ